MSDELEYQFANIGFIETVDYITEQICVHKKIKINSQQVDF